MYFRHMVTVVAIFLAAAVSVSAEPLEVDGLIEPHERVKIGSPVAGVLEVVDADRGAVVEKGQIVARLRSDVERANMELARARSERVADIEEQKERIAYTTRKLDRMEELHNKQAVAFEDLDDAQTNLALARIELKRATEDKRLAELDYRRATETYQKLIIRSPIRGVVVQRFLSPGEYVEDQPILEIAQIDPLNVEVILPVEALGRVSEGMSARVFPQEPVGGDLAATVTVVDKVVDAASGTFGVRLEMPNPEYRVAAGVKCRVRFPAD